MVQTHLKHKDRGFTIIELLVVVAVIGLLSAIVLAALQAASSKARDARRVAEMRNIVSALELHHEETGRYLEVPNTSPENDFWYGVGCGTDSFDWFGEQFLNINTSGLIPKYLPAVGADSLLDEDWNYCHWYAGPDYLGRDGFVLYYQFEHEMDMQRDCGDGDWGGYWYCLGK